MQKHHKKVIKTPKVIYCFIPALIIILWACSSTRSDITPSADHESLTTPFTVISEEAVVATEHWLQTQNAMTQTALPTLTPLSTFSPSQPVDNLSTITPIPNSTPAGAGAYLDVPVDVLGSKYEVQNAYYFDTLEGHERYELYAGAITGSGDEYTAQGVVVVRIFRVFEKNGRSFVDVISTEEYLTHLPVGPLLISSSYVDRYTGFQLSTPLNFVWFFNPHNDEMYLMSAITPLARLELGGKTQVAKLKGDSSVLSTSPLPLAGGYPFTAHLYLPLEEPPDKLTLSAVMASAPPTLQYDDVVTEDRAEWRTECPLCTPPISREFRELGELPLLRQQELSVPLESGFHVLIVNASWQEAEWFGNIGATYQFLIEIRE